MDRETEAERAPVASRRSQRRAGGTASRGPVVAEVLLVVAAAIPPLCFWCFSAWATLLTAALASVACASALWGLGPPSWPRPPLLVALAIAGLAATALGLVPLPFDTIELLGGGSATPLPIANARLASALLGLPEPTAAPMSVSPLDTRRALVVGAAVLALVVAAAVHVARGRRRSVLRAVGASSTTSALVVLGHLLVGTDRVYGVYPVIATMPLPGPLVNENRTAAFLALGATVTVGLALTARRRPVAAAWFTASVLQLVLCIFAVSRGGLLGLAVSVLAFAALVAASRRKDAAWPRGRVAVAALVVVLAAGLTAYAFQDALARDLGSTTLYKVRLAIQGLDLVARSPWLGVGRGGYSAAFVSLAGTDVRFEYPESFPVQWTAEWGLPFGAFLVVAMGVLVVRGLRQKLRMERIAALAAFLGLVVHELVDFATEVPGLMAVATLLAAAALEPHESATTRVPAKARPSAWLAVPAVTSVITLMGLPLLGTDLPTRREAIEAAIQRRDWPEADARVEQALRERPGEPALVLLGAAARAQRDDPSAVAWLNGAMRLAPRWSSPHLVAAEWLVRHGHPNQAWLELREVERRDPMRSVPSGCVLLVSTRSADEAIRVMGAESGGNGYLETMVEYCHDASPEAVARLDAHLLEGGEPGARVRAARQAIQAEDAARALVLLDGLPEDQVAIELVRASALVRTGRGAEAVARLRRLHVESADRSAWLTQLADAQAATGDLDGMRETLATLQGQAGGDGATLADAMIFEGDLEARVGNPAEAYAAYQRSDGVDPSRGGVDHALRLAASLGDTHRLQFLRTHLCARNPADPRCSAPSP